MNSTGYITLIILTLIFTPVVLITILSSRNHLRRQRQQLKIQHQEQQLNLELHPTYRAKVEEDRDYIIETRKLDLVEQKQQFEIIKWRAEFEHKRYLETTRAQPETYILDYEPRVVTALPSLKPAPQEKVNTYQQLLESPRLPPTEEYLLSHIKENSYTVSPGIRASTGEPVLVDITQVPHGKLIGSSGFGKSTCMYIMLKQAAETNHPRRLQLALLDLEHKTSRLLEDYPHVATLRVGKRLVQMVATSADQVAEYLGYLKLELDRRALLSEAELFKQPALLIYIEEMLSLQYEVIDPKLLQTIFYSLTILSVRGKKYGMFLYACMQTDYSTEELKISQKMFRLRGAASVDASAARAAGFTNTELVKHNFQHGKPGQLVVEFPSFSDLVLVPSLEIKREIARKTGFSGSFGDDLDTETPDEIPTLQSTSNTPATPLQTDATTLQARLQETRQLRANKWGKVAIIEKVWKVKPGSSKVYKQAEKEYEEIIRTLSQDEHIQQERIEA